MLLIDGSYGEGGGQILRTSLSASVISGRPVRLTRIRANRPKPGLAAQHLTVVRAMAQVCGAVVEGDSLGSQDLDFSPGGVAQAGHYDFDIGAARRGGSAGSTMLVLQALLLPLAMARGRSTVRVRGGTHTAWSPPFDYVQQVWLPTLGWMGIEAGVELVRWGWYPTGGGEVLARVGDLTGGRERPAPLRLEQRGRLRRIGGRAVTSQLPEHIASRMAQTAESELRQIARKPKIAVERPEASCSGAGIALTAEYEHVAAGFSALGKRGKPAEAVAREAARAALAFHRSKRALDQHLADQMLLPAALADGASSFTTERVTSHLQTNAWVIEQFGLARAQIDGATGRKGAVSVTPAR